jgi:hypothetical protein
MTKGPEQSIAPIPALTFVDYVWTCPPLDVRVTSSDTRTKTNSCFI